MSDYKYIRLITDKKLIEQWNYKGRGCLIEIVDTNSSTIIDTHHKDALDHIIQKLGGDLHEIWKSECQKTVLSVPEPKGESP